jgi:hypothetical protein
MCAQPPDEEDQVLDTCYLSMLARAATAWCQASQRITAAETLSDVLDVHRCGGRRLLITDEQNDKEVSGGNRRPFEYAQLPNDFFTERLELISGSAPGHWYQEHDGPIDCNILAAADAQDRGTSLVTTDLAFYQFISDRMCAGELQTVNGVWGPEFLGRLTLCGALCPEFFSVAIDRERSFLAERLAEPDGLSEPAAELRLRYLNLVEIEVARALQMNKRDGGAPWIY